MTHIEEKANVILAARTSLRPRCARALHVAPDALIKKLPVPLRRLIGNLADEERVLLGLGLDRKD